MTADTQAGGSIVAELERAELAARERRLTAQEEADRLVAKATARAREIVAGVPDRVAAALAELRARELEAAEAEVAAVEAESATDEGTATPGATTTHGATSNGLEAAIEAVVAAVLAEPTE